MRFCVQARDLEPGDRTDRGTIDQISSNGDTITLHFRFDAGRVELWDQDHVWVERQVGGVA